MSAAMDLSYAQNLEDYHLAQAFAGQQSGFYIDVEAVCIQATRNN